MPNHTSNLIEIYCWGEKETKLLEQFKKKFLKPNLTIDFNQIIPQPENISNEALTDEQIKQLAKRGVPHWYNWNHANWNTKWNAYSQRVIANKYCFCLYFQTAWSEPRPIIELMFKFAKENGMGLKYISSCEGGFFSNLKHIDEDGEITEEDLKEAWNGINTLFRVIEEFPEIEDIEENTAADFIVQK